MVMHDKGTTGEGSNNILPSKIVDQAERTADFLNLFYYLFIREISKLSKLTSLVKSTYQKSLSKKRDIKLFSTFFISSSFKPIELTKTMMTSEIQNMESTKKFLHSMMLSFFPIPC